ncbi:Ig-like domain-containing protein [Paenibacillus sp. 598K]|uniref:Ig-like domain-containing protein n=1 Tax=Paenibacillus sp. 598K TaxID=1117987 RepID=UPI00162837D2|nr:cadherin-like beta sandwich domain-containing protein [Paenibacillus sp. 598K]
MIMPRPKLRWTASLLCVLVLALVMPVVSLPTVAHAAGSITLDTPTTGATVTSGPVTVSGSYAGVYDVRLYINGTEQVEPQLTPSGADAGTWSYTLPTVQRHGSVELVARGLDTTTRYGVWSDSALIDVDNAAAAAPTVTITSPAEGVALSGVVSVTIDVQSATPVNLVQIRVNRSAWQSVALSGPGTYTYSWDTTGLGNRIFSLEARATNAPGRYGYSPTVYAQVGTGTNEPFAMPHQDRAMWIWEPESYKLLLNPGSRSVLESFIHDTTFDGEPVTTLYLAVGSYAGYRALEEQTEQLKSFMRWAHARDLQVHALIAGGTSPAYMGAYERYHHHAVREMEQIVNYNLSAAANERFDGINVDIEPYISPDFKDSSKFLQGEYLDGLSKMIARRDAAGINLPFGPAIPKWYDTSEQGANIVWNGQTKWLSEHIQDISDYISIMDYRDTADGTAGIIAGAAGEMAYAELIGKPDSVVIGVETLDIANSGDPETITFWEEGRLHMEAELDKVYTAFDPSSAFGGIAVHHYDSYRMLPAFWGDGGYRWQPPADTTPPSALAGTVTATAQDYQTVQVRYGMATDNTEVDRYVIYRSEQAGFTPTAADIAGLSRSQTFQDKGLLPDTTYYYRIAARDLQGNIGPATAEVAVTTGSTTLQPLIVNNLNISHSAGKFRASFTVADLATGAPLPGALAEGRFTYAGGRYAQATTDASGNVTIASEDLSSALQAGFEPRRIALAGYYYASAYDEPHTTTYKPWHGLGALTASSGTWSQPFATAQTLYTLTVPASVTSLILTPTAAEATSVIVAGGERVASGSAAAPIAIGSGPATVSVQVYNADGTTDNYVLRIARS